MMDPIGYPDTSRFRLMDMFTACTSVDVKKTLSSLQAAFC